MTEQELVMDINQAKRIARQLHDLLHDDAMHRLQLYHEYSQDTLKWTPNLYRRCQLVDTLCDKLERLELFQH